MIGLIVGVARVTLCACVFIVIEFFILATPIMAVETEIKDNRSFYENKNKKIWLRILVYFLTIVLQIVVLAEIPDIFAKVIEGSFS